MGITPVLVESVPYKLLGLRLFACTHEQACLLDNGGNGAPANHRHSLLDCSMGSGERTVHVAVVIDLSHQCTGIEVNLKPLLSLNDPGFRNQE